ncbi:MAG: S-layer homology domain-containing protein [Patescibacteria group bacterium]
MNEPTTMTFVDVSRTSDLAKYIEATVFLNIFSGQLRNTQRIFRPNDPITRAEIAKVVVNTF